MEEVSKLIQALSVAAWPVMVFYVIWSFRKQVAAVIESARGRKFLIEVGGQKLSMEEANHQQQELIADLQKQLNELRQRVEGVAVPAEAGLARGTAVDAMGSQEVLWVDDNPKNNSFFIEQLSKSGYRVELALSTDEALRKMSKQAYRLLLTDMGREEGGRFVADAGIVLLERIREQGEHVPVVFFCGDRSVERYRERAKALGAHGMTSSGTELSAILAELAPRTA